jgi:transcriptional regulator with PAS, ATPase and Fis domain
MVEAETFREDLYYRINVITIQVPSLKERKEDVPLLVDFFLERKCKERNAPSKKLTSRALQKFYDYAWPGNIRELENEIERLVVLTGEETQIDVEAISARIRDYKDAGGSKGGSSGGSGGNFDAAEFHGTLKDALEGLEKMMIREGLKRTRFNKSQLARELGISRASLIMKVERYQLDKRFQKKDEAA